MGNILAGNIEKDWIEKTPSERFVYTLDFANKFAVGQVDSYSVHATDSSGVSVDTTILAGYGRSGTKISIGVQGGSVGDVFTVTSKVTSSEIAPDKKPQVFEADVKIRII